VTGPLQRDGWQRQVLHRRKLSACGVLADRLCPDHGRRLQPRDHAQRQHYARVHRQDPGPGLQGGREQQEQLAVRRNGSVLVHHAERLGLQLPDRLRRQCARLL